MIELIELFRDQFTEQTTIGELFLDGVRECFMLEDVRRGPGIKIPGKTCIPPGEYWVKITHSPKYGRDMPRVYNVITPDGRMLVQNEGITFEGILQHPGNGPEDTEGCQLTGLERVKDRVLKSKVAFDVYFSKLVLAGADKNPIRFIVRDRPSA